MKLLFLLLMIVGGLVALVVLAGLITGVVAVVYSLLPIPKVPMRYNLRNLQVRWKTTAVTALAFTMVIGLLTVMLAFVQGMDHLVKSSGHPGNIIVLAAGSTDESFSSLPAGVDVLQLPKDVQEMVQKEGDKFLAVREVYVVVVQERVDPQTKQPTGRFVQMRGLDDVELAARIHGLELQPGGQWFSGRTYDVVLGASAAETFGPDLGKSSAEPGDEIQLGSKKWRVTGVMKASGSTFANEVWAQDTHLQESFGRKTETGPSYSSFIVRVKDPALAEQASELIDKQKVTESFTAMTEKKYYANLSQTNLQFMYAAIVVAVVMAVGGVLGVMNTMFAAISQRRKDIGVLRLLGYSRWQVLVSFLTESLVIALIGGLLGLALGSLVDGWTAKSIVAGSGGGGKSIILTLLVDRTALFGGLGLTIVMGLVGGLMPSLSAMRLRPLESLR
jgi:ABC-type lipoprotein release transport system permease subunit